MNKPDASRVSSAPTPPPDAPQPVTPLGWLGRGIGGLFLLVVLYVGVRLMYEQVLAPFYAPTPAITVGHDTTRIDGPLDPDGYVDYVAALEGECSAGVTPENNAVVLLFQAVGPGEVSGAYRDEFFGMLGMRIPPEEGDYLRDEKFPPIAGFPDDSVEADTARRRRAFEYDQAQTRPWTREEFSLTAQWFDANAGPLETIVAATKRTRWYAPLIGARGEGGLAACLLLYTQSTRNAARALTIRAMQRVAAGEFEAAVEDAEAIDRLAVHIGQGPILIDWLVQHAIAGNASEVYRAIAVDPRLDPTLRVRLRERQRQRPALSGVDRCIDHGERYCYLDACQFVALTSDHSTPTALVDWNEALRQGNPWFDSAVAALRVEGLRERRTAIDDWETQVQLSRGDWQQVGYWTRAWLGGESSRTLRGRAIGLITASMMLPACSNLPNVEMRDRANRDLADLAFALAEFHAANGIYPQTLAELSPEQVEKLPDDIFSATPMPYGYERTAAGYVLFSRYEQESDDTVPDSDSPASQNGLVLRVPIEKREFVADPLADPLPE